MAAMDGPTEISLLLYPGVRLGAVYGLADLFAVANRIIGNRSEATRSLRVSLWQLDPTFAAVERVSDTHPQLRSRPAVVIVPPRLDEPLEPEMASRFAGWLTERHRTGSILCAICAGIFVLAETGLLAGRRVAAHWSHTETLLHRFPEILVDENRLVIDDGDLITAGGLMAWTDIGLTLIDRLLGPASMLETARFLLVNPAEQGRSFNSNFAPNFCHGDEAVLKVQHWIQARTARDLTLSAMAQHARLEQRTFLRRFHKATGFKPTEYCQRVRVGNARELLEFTCRPVEQIAALVGYEDPSAFRKIFRRVTGLLPREYRLCYSGRHVALSSNTRPR